MEVVRFVSQAFSYLVELNSSCSQFYLRLGAMDQSSDRSENQVEEEDRLSPLPDDILLNILQRLHLRNAVQTSTLSRRWRHLPRLVFDCNEFVQCSSTRTVSKVMASYSEALRRLLASTRECTIKELRLTFFAADIYHLHSIGQVVGNAVESGNTESLEFGIWPEIQGTSCTTEHLTLFGRRFMSFLDACPNTFRWLTRLYLLRMQFGEADIPNILNTCEKLQAFTLYSCQLSQPGSVLKIDAPGSRLVELKFIKCYFSQVELICVLLLARLVYDTWLTVNPPLRFGCVPRLHDIQVASALFSWQVPFSLSGYLSNTRNLSILHLDFHDEMVWFRPEDAKTLAPVFTNLKVVHLYNIFPYCDLEWTSIFLEAAPSLDSLYVKISRHICGRYKRKGLDNADRTNLLCEASNFKHYNLNLLNIKGFEMEEKLISYTKLVMERAVALKKIRLQDKEQCKRCDHLNKQTPSPMRFRFPNNEGDINLIRKQLTDGLSSSSIEIIIDDMVDKSTLHGFLV